MENITKFLRNAFYVVLFFISVTMLYQSSKSLYSVTKKSGDVIADDNNLYQANLTDTNHYIQRAELIAILMEDVSYNINIVDPSGTYSVEADSYNPVNITGIVLSANQYEKSYSYDESGKIVKIMYRFIS
jgi:Flp pilus assembly protein TadG